LYVKRSSSQHKVANPRSIRPFTAVIYNSRIAHEITNRMHNLGKSAIIRPDSWVSFLVKGASRNHYPATMAHPNL